MRSPRLRLAAGVVLALALSPLGAAEADTASHYDASGDLSRAEYDNETQTNLLVPAPGAVIGDIAKLRVSFEGETVRISTTFRSLPKTGVFRTHDFRIATSQLQRSVFILAGSGNWAGNVIMERWDGRRVPCKGLAHRIDYSAKVAIIYVPRSCISADGFKPGAVRGGAVAYIGDDEGNSYADDANRDAPLSEYGPPTLGPRVFR